MSWTIDTITEKGHGLRLTISDVPDECPLCHHKGTFSPYNSYYNSIGTLDKKLEIIFRCPHSKCHRVFIGYYKSSGSSYDLVNTAPKIHIAKIFSDTIKMISPDFQEIYTQASQAEAEELTHVCGPGYRKALEFLVKDYLIGKTPDDAKTIENIKREFLGDSIKKRIEDASIKSVAKRAAWLGNDETHYVRKWVEKDLQDLKKLIDLTVHWMEAEALTAQLMRDMPE